MPRTPRPPLEYERRCLVFVDVLGWSDLVRRSVADVESRKTVTEAYRRLIETNQFIQGMEATDPQRQIGWAATLLSDSFAVSCRTEDAAHMLSHIAGDFVLLLVRHKVCVRGAVVAGDLYHHANVIIGPALIDAVQLEQKVACYPRLLVDPSVQDVVPKDWVFQDADGMETLDYLVAGSDNPEQLLHDAAAAAKIVRAKVCEYERTPSLKAKYRWLLRYIETTEAAVREATNG